ncbi:MAG TPA: aminotransferase class I/II-fold pyridoxal phosphate-dependent enzyme [Metabacillus sp.]|nr:aminotransferase class I/II-fold pyridoxal phosphate-dependent enzyme [Metabacillus sp.]
MEKIPFLKPNLVKQDSFKEYISEIEKTRHYSNYGPLNTVFESRVLSEYFNGIGGVTTVNNATTGLMLAINQIKRPEGCFALMPSFTFSATPLAAMWCGLEPYFVDINKEDWCMNKDQIKDILAKMADKVAVIVPYATFGTNMNLSFYKDLHEQGLPVVIDAAPSFGTMGVDGAFSTGFPGISVFSLHATKSFGIGEGGLIYSSDDNAINEIRQAGNFGFSSNRETVSKGLNSKLSEYGAAIALATLDAFPEKREMRQKIFEQYRKEFQSVPFLKEKWAMQKTEGQIAHQFMSVLCPEGHTNADYVKLLADNHIEARTYFSPVCHQQKFFSAFNQTDLSVTNKISKRIISLPLWEEMKKEDVNKIVTVLSKGL